MCGLCVDYAGGLCVQMRSRLGADWEQAWCRLGVDCVTFYSCNIFWRPDELRYEGTQTLRLAGLLIGGHLALLRVLSAITLQGELRSGMVENTTEYAAFQMLAPLVLALERRKSC